MSDPKDYLFHYQAYVVGVYDGDTITVNIDLGLRMGVSKEKLRLFGIDAPEVRGEAREEGLRSRDRLRELVLHQEVTIQTIKDKKGKYGRYLARVWIGDRCVNDVLVEEGLARPYEP